jgi:hypothetical protein
VGKRHEPLVAEIGPRRRHCVVIVDELFGHEILSRAGSVRPFRS